jgi:hypothetical protein
MIFAERRIASWIDDEVKKRFERVALRSSIAVQGSPQLASKNLFKN